MNGRAGQEGQSVVPCEYAWEERWDVMDRDCSVAL